MCPPPLVEIGLTDLPKSGGDMPPPTTPLATGLVCTAFFENLLFHNSKFSKKCSTYILWCIPGPAVVYKEDLCTLLDFKMFTLKVITLN